MKLAPAIAALFLFVPVIEAQYIDVTTSSRTATASAYGFDYEYDDGIYLSTVAPTPTGEWISDLDADLGDYWGYAVGRGQAFHKSLLDGDELHFDLVASTSTARTRSESSTSSSRTRTAVRSRWATRWVVPEPS